MSIKNTQADLDFLQQKYAQKKREIERNVVELRILRKQIDLTEDQMIVEMMASREQPKREVL